MHKDIFEQLSETPSSVHPVLEFLVLAGFNHIDPLEFEKLVMKMFEVLGFKGQLTPASGDDGIDIILRDTNDTIGIVQCKRYNDNQVISAKDMREFLGSMTHAKAEYGYFVTTTAFSEQAKEFSKDKNIYLVDSEKLKRLLLLSLDVRTEPKNKTANGTILRTANETIPMLNKTINSLQNELEDLKEKYLRLYAYYNNTNKKV